VNNRVIAPGLPTGTSHAWFIGDHPENDILGASHVGLRTVWMRYSFSAEFMRVLPPDTTFGSAWESLCFEPLAPKLGLDGLQ
jgi:FMN phosphatase YigB (HAD superfamily)